MLSIGAMAAGQGAYYQDLAREDYYLQGGEPPGHWWGKGAERLNLTGQVTAPQLKNLFRGYDKQGKPLIQNAGQMTGEGAHQPGWDLTFSAPKSVSVLWSQGTEGLRHELQRAQDQAVKRALDYMESHHSLTRRGKAGAHQEQARLVAALYEHGTSRALDPQLHTHALVMNVAVREDGTTGTILSKPFYLAKMVTGALYRAELAAELQQLGFAVKKTGNTFEIVGVSEALCDFFSKRRQAILQELGERGLESAAAAAAATLATREPKDIVPPRNDLFQRWQEQGRGHTSELRPPKRVSRESAIDQAVNNSIEELTKYRSHFTAVELTREIAQQGVTLGLGVEQVMEAVQLAAADQQRLVVLDDSKAIFTTPAMIKLEEQMLEDASKLHTLPGAGVTTKTQRDILEKYSEARRGVTEFAKDHASQFIKAALKQHTEPVSRGESKERADQVLTGEQKKAVKYLTSGTGGRLKVLDGLAGAGKTAALRAAREAWERDGFKVVGIGVNGKATRDLQKETGIHSMTVGTLFKIMESGIFDRAWSNLKQSPRGMLKRSLPKVFKNLKTPTLPILRLPAGGLMPDIRPTWLKHLQDPNLLDFRLTKKTIVVVDQASMLDTKNTKKLLEQIERKGAQVVFVGDHRLNLSIGAGSPFAAIADRFPGVQLGEIQRQHEHEDRKVVKQVSEPGSDSKNKMLEALKDLARRGLLKVEQSKDTAILKLINDWHQQERIHGFKNSLIVVQTSKEAKEISRQCQERRFAAGDLKRGPSIQVDGTTFHEGDRIVIRKRSKTLGVENGDVGTIKGIHKMRLTQVVKVRLDNGRVAALPVREFKAHLSLGYAFAAFDVQNTTVDRNYVLATGDASNQQISYLQLSRGRESTRLYTTKLDAGAELEQLATQMSRSTEKKLAVDVKSKMEVGR